MNKLSLSYVVGYGILALALSFVSIPIYIYIPKYYAKEFSVSFKLLGFIILTTRMFDAIIDPIIGIVSDNLIKQRFTRIFIINISSVFLVLGFYLLLNPMIVNSIAIWLIISLTILHFAFSIVSINHLALITDLNLDDSKRIAIISWREFFGLVGLLLASGLPPFLISFFGSRQAMFYYSLIFIPIVVISVIFINYVADLKSKNILFKNENFVTSDGFKKLFILFWNNTQIKKLLMIFALNGIATSITSNLILFFIETIIKAPEHEGYFLLSFFVSCAFSISIWKRISLKIGKSDAWLYSIICSIMVFLWSFFLTAGDIYFFYIICILSGLCLGADLILPSAMVTEIIYNKNHGHDQSYSGFYFGIWTFVTKMNLALAAGLILPILGFFGYNYQMSSYSTGSLFCLSFLYSIVPCCFKLLAAILILKNKKFIANLNEKNSF